MVHSAEIIRLGKKSTIKARAYKKSKDYLMQKQKMFSVGLAALSCIHAIIATYFAISTSSAAAEYFGMIIAILIAAGSAYVSISDFPEKIAKYEVASSMYTHVSSFFINLYNGQANRLPEATELGIEYCKSTIDFLDGISGGLDFPENNFSEKNDSIYQKYEKQITNLCGNKPKYMDAYKYTYEAYAKKLHFHVYIEKNNQPNFCQNHIIFITNNYIFSDHFIANMQKKYVIFKSWINEKSTHDKVYAICEKTGPVSLVAVVVERSVWDEADVILANSEIDTHPNILDSDMFNSDIYHSTDCEVIIED